MESRRSELARNMEAHYANSISDGKQKTNFTIRFSFKKIYTYALCYYNCVNIWRQMHLDNKLCITKHLVLLMLSSILFSTYHFSGNTNILNNPNFIESRIAVNLQHHKFTISLFVIMYMNFSIFYLHFSIC